MDFKETLMTDEDFFDWCGSHQIKGCGTSRLMEYCAREVSKCEDCRALAQAEITWDIAFGEGKKAGQKAESDRWLKLTDQEKLRDNFSAQLIKRVRSQAFREVVEQIEKNFYPLYNEGELGKEPPCGMWIGNVFWQSFKEGIE